MPAILSKPLNEEHFREKFYKSFVDEVDTFYVSVAEKEKSVVFGIATLNEKVQKGLIKIGDRLRFKKTINSILLVDGDDKIVYNYTFKSLDTSNVDVPTLTDELQKFEEIFNKKENLAGFYKHQGVMDYACFDAEEFVSSICQEEKYGKLTLKDCDVRTCKINGRKYKRITFTGDRIAGFSHLELCFGSVIDGWTYVLLPEAWKQVKKQIMPQLNFVKTTYGEKTRWDMEGNEYEVKH